MGAYARLFVCLACVVVTSLGGSAQQVEIGDDIGGPLIGPTPFVAAPFSADAVTNARHQLPDGSQLDRSTTARYYRDGEGRVRVELPMEGLPPPRTLSERHLRLTICPMADVLPGVPEPRVNAACQVSTRSAIARR
jgi:hypothetical protein